MRSRQRITAENVQKELQPGQSIELLKHLHLLTREGQLNADARRKLKQVNHLINLLRPALDDIFSRHSDPLLVDVGSGKSYLGFLLYDLYVKQRDSGHILAIEQREDLMQRVRPLADQLHFSRMQFLQSAAENASLPPRVHMVMALHACDTATDDALLLGLRAKADYIAVVPCCQAEVARLLAELPPTPLLELYQHPIHRREFGSHLTNVFRALVLQAMGYQVTVTELVGWDHSLKNELILARRIRANNPAGWHRLMALRDLFPVKSKLLIGLDQLLSSPSTEPTDPPAPPATDEIT